MYSVYLYRPIKPSLPTMFAFDPRSPIRKFLPANVNINEGLEKFELPTEYDFHMYPEDDALAPLYK